ncbi:restriction endonuclease subunit S, partial [Lactococcus lactis]|uniref:restriction endonuclease subunit S n=2 Tax=Lactococcus lactis TaxID=1358 RepID=UPI0020B82037
SKKDRRTRKTKKMVGTMAKIDDSVKKKVPELRFPGFTDDWEERKLGDITKISTGKLDANAMVENGKYDFYTSGIKKYRINVAAFEGPSITIAGNGATVGYMHLADNKFNAYQRTYVLQEFLVDRSFIFSEIGNKLPKKIKQEARTGNIPYIVMDMLTELKLSIPQNNLEQQKIGSFFKQLDETIALHQCKLDLLKEQKKGFLQKMFV